MVDSDGPVEVASQFGKGESRKVDQIILTLKQYTERQDLVEQRPVFEKIPTIPSNHDVAAALAKVKNREAPGNSGILPEMVTMGINNEEFYDLLTNLVWKEQQVPQEWVDAILIPIPKKGNLKCCDNWRGISLLEVIGKVVARVVQNRLQELLRIKLLPESQRGFRKGQGYNEMIFTIR